MAYRAGMRTPVISDDAQIRDFLAGGGEMGARMRAMNWHKTPLGAAGRWPRSLKTAVRIMLTCRQPMFVWWGDQLINLYNDAYRSVIGGKHPKALGKPASEVWREIWAEVGPRAASAMLNNEGTFDESLLLIMERNGYQEETYYTFSYSPVPNDEGGTGGIICANTEETRQIVGERQLALLRELAARTADARTFDEACSLSASCLSSNLYDLPFAMIYLVEPQTRWVELAGASGIDKRHAAAPEKVDLHAASAWPFADVVANHEACLVRDLSARFAELPTGAWERPPHQAIAVPIASSGEQGKAGVLVVGLNPYRLFDDNYQGFVDLVAAQIAASIANAQAYEEERKRAEALAELDKAKTAFFSNVSHEFRTPLTLMLGTLENALQRENAEVAPRVKGDLEVAHRNSLRLLKLVNTLLDFSRIEAGRTEASYEPTDISAYTSELASTFRSAVERAGLRLLIDCRELPEPAFLDRDMWKKIVFNLISNAFKYTLSGEIEVRLRAIDGHASLTVRDTGTGIPTEALPRLFDRFYRIQGARGRTHEGTGIGLALVQELVKLHGGTVTAASTLDEGSTFTVSVPLGQAHLPAARLQAGRRLTPALGASPFVQEALRWLPGPPRPPGSIGVEHVAGARQAALHVEGASAHAAAKRPTVLLADDNADMREYVCRLLRERYEVTAVADGAEALAVVQSTPPDLVLSDVMMPRMDGIALLAELRSREATCELPVILLSARAGEEAKIGGLEAGADDYLIKPFSARELLVRVATNLRMAGVRREAAGRITQILENITDGFLAFDRDWRYTYVNAETERITGMRRAEFLGNSIWELLPATRGTILEKELRRAVAERVSVEFEYLFEPWGRWFALKAYPLADGALSVYFQDITVRKRAAETIKEAEERWRLAVQSADIGTWDSRPLTGGLHWDRRCKEMFGLPPEAEVDHETFLAGLHPEDRERTLQAARSSLDPASGGFYDVEYRTVGLQDGGMERWVRATGRAFFNEAGQAHRFIGTVTDITERKKTEKELVYLANYDALTELPNRVLFMDRLRQVVAGALRHEQKVGLLFLDLDGFKHVNDTLGHAVGDQLLKAVAARLTARVRASDTVARFGGDEFAVMLPDAKRANDVNRVAQGLMQTLCEPFELAGNELFITTSIGISLYPRDADDAPTLLKSADAAMYQAKKHGNRYQHYSRALSVAASRRLALERELRRALARDEFVLHYQPQVEVASGRINAIEALGLWLLIPPYDSLAIPSLAEGARLVLFMAIGVLVSTVAESMHRATRKAVANSKSLHAEVRERRDAESALRRSEERFRMLVDAVRDYAIFMLDTQSRVASWNAGAERIFGFSEQEIIGRPFSLLFTPEDRAAGIPKREIAQAGASGRGDDERWHLRKDGSRFFASGIVTPMYDESGPLRGYVKIARDITARRQAQEALRQSEERFRSLATATASIVWTATAGGAMVEEVPSWQAFTGQTPDEYKGFGWLEALHPEDRGSAADTWARVLKDKQATETEFRLRRHDGGYRHMLGRAAPVLDAGGEVREWVGTCVDISGRKEAEQRLVRLANYDTLTELPNRALFMDRLSQEIARALRYEQKVAVLFLDLDGFKHVNDTLGHDAGDLLLKAVAERLAGCVRGSDTVARFGGDEFALMLPDVVKAGDANRVANGVVRVLSKPFEIRDNELFITTSLGISLYPRDGDDPMTLLKSADAAMYQAKKNGNRYQHYSRALGAQASRHLSLEREMRQALARDEFVLHYQPQVELASGRIDTVEALLRWRHPDSDELMLPWEFISVAEECGLIVPIGEWVLHAACAQLQSWRAKGPAPERLAVNVSARQFHQNNLKKTIDRCLSDKGIDHACLELELTESMLHSERAERLLPALRKTGIKIAIDDFGTGFSSLSYLKRFPVHKLKIDRSFTRKIPAHTNNAAISTAVIAMAHSLDLEVTAEGVETAEQLAFLRELRCDGAQGYLLSKPLPADDLGVLLAGRAHDAPGVSTQH